MGVVNHPFAPLFQLEGGRQKLRVMDMIEVVFLCERGLQGGGRRFPHPAEPASRQLQLAKTDPIFVFALIIRAAEGHPVPGFGQREGLPVVDPHVVVAVDSGQDADGFHRLRPLSRMSDSSRSSRKEKKKNHLSYKKPYRPLTAFCSTAVPRITP